MENLLTDKIKNIDIEDEMKNSYLDYAMSVIVGRALPDVRDGLKPVHRRILYAMFKMGLLNNKAYRKCAAVVGEVMGKFHPHGDAAIYDTLVRMAQDFSMRNPLIDGQGNFGSVDGDAAAAMRYTESRLAKLAEELLSDINKNTVDFTPNYDESLLEPVVLPSSFPNLLVNGSSGIAVGMSTNIPPHNLGEIVDALVHLIKDPDVSVGELMEHVNGPDFPTGATICERAGIISAYQTGRGIVKIRSKIEVEEIKGGREQIIVREIPYMVNKARLVEHIAELVQDKKIEGISDLRDESDRDGMRIVIELKRGENAQIISNLLYKHSSLQSSFGIIMLALVDGQPKILNLREMLYYYLEHRKTVVVRRTQFELNQSEARAHLLEGLKVALDNLDAVIALIRNAPDAQTAQIELIQKFELSELQSKAILEMRLQRLTGLERQKIEDEYQELLKTIGRLKGILADPGKVLKIIETELREIKKLYASPRRTVIKEMITEFSMEDLIENEEVVITISHDGYLKRQPIDTYKRRRRGGKGQMGMRTKEVDFVEHLFIAHNHDYILFFTNTGMVHWLKVYQVPVSGPMSKGKAIVNLLNITSKEKITAYIPISEFKDGLYTVMATKNGVVKKTDILAYSRPRANGIIALKLDEGDELIGVCLTTGEQNILLATNDGHAIHFKETDVRPMGRVVRGVRGITLRPSDSVIGMVVVEPKTTILSVTEHGYGKRTLGMKYRLIRRGGKGVINIQTTKRNGRVVGIRGVEKDDEIMLITAAGKLIRSSVNDIRAIGRNTQGVRLIRLNPKEDRVVAIASVAPSDDENDENGK